MNRIPDLPQKPIVTDKEHRSEVTETDVTTQQPSEAVKTETESSVSFPTIQLPKRAFETSLAEECNVIGVLTVANGGYSTIESQSDPEFVLYEQLCLARLSAIANSSELVSDSNGLIDPSIAEIYERLGQALESVVSRVSQGNVDDIIVKTLQIVESASSPRQELLDTGRICLGIGYKMDNSEIAIASAVLMYALGEQSYGEIVGHHLAHGVGADRNIGRAFDWYSKASIAFKNGATSIFTHQNTERDNLIEDALDRLTQP